MVRDKVSLLRVQRWTVTMRWVMMTHRFSRAATNLRVNLRCPDTKEALNLTSSKAHMVEEHRANQTITKLTTK